MRKFARWMLIQKPVNGVNAAQDHKNVFDGNGENQASLHPNKNQRKDAAKYEERNPHRTVIL